MRHQALFRKYRSQTFGDLVGQEHVVRTLRHSIELQKISQAYLFTGPRGTGKTSTARLMAKALNCTGGPSAEIPEDDPICKEIASGTCMDVVEIDAASESGVDQVREHIVQASEYQPSYCRYKVFIIDEVHDLSAKAFDALLKTIEEPPDHVVFILATTEFNKVPQTIRSRCQRFDFHRGTVQDLVGRLSFVAEQEGIKAEPAALTAIARMADGGYRDALTLFEQAMITGDGAVTLAHVYDQLGLVADERADGLIMAVAQTDIKAITEGLEAIYQTGRDPGSIVESLLHRLSDLTRAAYQVPDKAGSDAAVEAGLTATAQRIGAEKILAIRGYLAEAHKGIRDVSLPRIWLEAEMVRISQRINAPVVPVSAQGSSGQEAVSAGGGERVSTRSASPSSTSSVTPQRAVVERVSTSQPKMEEPVEESVQKEPVAEVTAKPESPEEAWRVVVKNLCALSKTANMRLPKSQLVGDEGGVLTVSFPRVSDAEWVTDNSKVQKAIHQEWKKLTGQEATFRFVGPETTVKKSAPSVEKASVESPIEGDALLRELDSQFEAGKGHTDSDETP